MVVGMIADLVPAGACQADKKPPPVLFVQLPRNQPLCFQIADQGANRIAADPLPLADFRRIQPAARLKSFLNSTSDPPTVIAMEAARQR